MVLLNSKDLVIESGKIKYYFSYLDWDSKFFNKPSYVIDTAKSYFCGSSKSIVEKIQTKFKNCFVTAKIDTSFDYEVLKELQNAGFYYVGTEIKLQYQKNIPIQKSQITKQNIEIKKIDKNQFLPYEEIGVTFQHTRFHTDLNISMEKADDLWVQYLLNYTPDKNHFMYVARINTTIAGVILANKNKNQISLFYVAIRKECQGLGVGTKLICHVANQFNQYEIMTETQVNNIQAMNYYIKNNFTKIISTYTILHFW